MNRFFCMVAMCLLPTATAAQEITSARYAGPTRAYDHGVLGDNIEYTKLILRAGGRRIAIEVGEGFVFEDLAPRVVDLNGDGRPEVITVRTDMQRGASLAIYGVEGLITQTPPIGRRFRWLAPIGVGDFDSNGRLEIAYVETPHLGKVLKIYHYFNRELVLATAVQGFSNHRIGEEFISGGVRNCGQGDEIITADSSWQRILATTVQGGSVSSRVVGTVAESGGFARVLACR